MMHFTGYHQQVFSNFQDKQHQSQYTGEVLMPMQ
jgi:hypothetical protein